MRITVFTLIIVVIFLVSVFRIFNSEKSEQKNSTSIIITNQKYPSCTDHDFSHWHAPVKKDKNGKVVCSYGHEHGDDIPSWVREAGYNVSFDHIGGFHANTSDFENTQKHTSMKGFLAKIKEVDVYIRIHLASNPLERTARFHSYELFAKDQKGGISHFQGWLDTGDPIVDRIPYSDSTAGVKGKDTGKRPIVWAVTKHACVVDKTWCIELWVAKTSSWGPEITWAINDPTTYFVPNETYDVNTSNWEKTNKLGADRSFSFTFLKTENIGRIWATQFGEIVSGADDEKCFSQTEKHGVVYNNICLENYISETLPEITRIENTVNKVFDTTGVVLPN